MFHVVRSAAHAAKQNPEFPLHVSDLGPERGYYYMAQNSPLRPNRIRYMPLYMGCRTAEVRDESIERGPRVRGAPHGW